MNYYERHIGDYLKDTAHLSLLEHGIYTRLLDVYYTREGAIPESDAARLIGARSKDEREALKAVLSEFFKLVEGACVQDRADREIARFKDKQAKAKKSAEARWGAQPPQSEGNANASQTHGAQAMRTHSEGNATRARPQTPDTRHQTPIQNPNTSEASPPHPSATPDGSPDGLLPGMEPPTPKPSPKTPPDCPHQAVLALWAEVLPQLPQHSPAMWRGARAAHLRARWRETAALKGWPTEAEGLAYFRRLFGYVGQSRFLTGRAPSSDPNKPPFVVELAWLVCPENWAKVHEGKYHPEAA